MHRLAMKLSICAAAFAGAGITAAFQDTEAMFYTQGYNNGRRWKAIERAYRSGYVVGADEERAWTGDKWSKFRLSQIGKFTHADVMKVIEQIYAQPENALLPIVAVHEMAINKLTGQYTQEEFERMLVEMRQAVNSSQ